MEDNLVAARIKEERVCVIIPTYNNAKTLRRVLDGVLHFTESIIVVNDGSTDETADILKVYQKVSIINHPKNIGKGMALRNAFALAIQKGFLSAITIDSDGQHFPSEIPVFIENNDIADPKLLIGARNMNQVDVPKKSSFGNKFSNFWYWVETGIRLQDTQSGFRLYPLSRMPKKYFTRKFEFEIEVIVRAAWSGIEVKNVPVSVLYDKDERVSHFRPFQDFARISVLNTFLVLIALFYIKPRDWIRKIKKKGFHRFFVENILDSNEPNSRKAMAIALGVFVGISPLWGFQTVIVLFLAALFRLNKVVAFTFSQVSFPPLIPFVIYGSLLVGGFLFGNTEILPSDMMSFSSVKDNLAQYLVGSFILASIMATVFGIVGYLLLHFFNPAPDK